MAFDNVDYMGAEPAALVDTDPEHIQLCQLRRKRRFYGYSGRTVSQLLATLLAGALIGATGQVLQSLIDTGVSIHNQLLQQALGIGLGSAFGAELIISVSLVLAAGSMVLLFAPLAAGGGVAAVMAALNGNDIQGLLGLDVYAVKLVGCMLSRVARLAVGVEAPMAHLGACVASAMCRGEQRFWEWVQERQAAQEKRSLSNAASIEPDGYEALPASSNEVQVHAPQEGQGQVANGTEGEQWVEASGPGGSNKGSNWPGGEEDEELQTVGNQAAQVDHSMWHREMVSAGVAAGIAGAFGAPLGGVLFALEEACTHWSRKVAWRCFLCAAMATFVHSQLSATRNLGILAISGAPTLTPHQWLLQLPLMAAVSAGAALLGASHNLLRGWLRRLSPPNRTPAQSLGEAMAVAAATVATIAGLSAAVGSCRPLPKQWSPGEIVQHLCPEGEYNDLATMFLGSSVFVIKSLIGQGSDDEPLHSGCSKGVLHNCYFSLPSLAALCASYLLLAALASNLVVPGGLFMPSIIIGGSFGTLCGIALSSALPSAGIQPGVMAVVGTAAALGGVFHSSISLVAILVEGTQGINQALGIIVAIAISHYVAHLCGTDSVYHDDLARNEKIQFLHEEPPYPFKHMTAVHVMHSPVLGFDAIVPVAQVKAVLRQTTHNGFVVSTVRDPVSGLGRLDGFILRSQLLVLLRSRAFCDPHGRYLNVAPWAVQKLEQELALAMQERTRRSHNGRLLLVPDGSSSEEPSPLLSPLRSVVLDDDEGAEEGAQPARKVQVPPSPGVLSHEAVALLARSLSLGTAQEPPWQAYSRSQQAAQPAFPSTPVAGLHRPDTQSPHPFRVEDSAEERLYLNLSPFMNRAPMSVRRFTPANRVHGLFLSLSLRHLCVIDRSNAAVGIITRQDLVRAGQRCGN